jgi:adenine phosphoribosyltransferase
VDADAAEHGTRRRHHGVSPGEDGPLTTIDRALLESRIRDVPDFPKPGIVFKDVTPLLADPAAFAHAIEAMSEAFCDEGIDKVVGIEARGFILAAPVALACGAGFVPARKAGKLPAARRGVSYELEYGSETIELHDDAFSPGDRVLIVDDVLATGGTAAATVELVETLGGEVVGLAFLIELGFLDGAARLSGRRHLSLLTF